MPAYLYTGNPIAIDTTTTVKFVAVASDGTISDLQTAYYEIPPLEFTQQPTVDVVENVATISYGTSDPFGDEVFVSGNVVAGLTDSFAYGVTANVTGVVTSGSTDTGTFVNSANVTGVVTPDVNAVATFSENLDVLTSAGATESSVQTMLSSVLSVASALPSVSNVVLTGVESVLSTLVATPSVTDLLEQVSTRTPFEFTQQPIVNVVGQDYVVTYSTIDTENEEVGVSGSVTVTAADLLVRVENVLATLQAVPTVSSAMQMLDNIVVGAVATSSVQETFLANVGEQLTVATSSLASVADVQMMVNGVTAVAVSSGSVEAVLSYLHNLNATLSATAGVTDRYIPALLNVGPRVVLGFNSPIELEVNLVSDLETVVSFTSYAEIK